jgi:hypothetical protein
MQSQRELGIHLIAVRAVDRLHDTRPQRRSLWRVEWLLLSTIVTVSYAVAWLISAAAMAARGLVRRATHQGHALKPTRAGAHVREQREMRRQQF